MTTSDFNFDRLLELADLYCVDSLDDEQIAQLQEILREDPAACAAFGNYLQMHTNLEERLLSENVVLPSRDSSVDGGESRFGRSLQIFLRTFSRPTPLSLTIAALVIGLLVTAMAFMLPPFYRAIARPTGEHQPDVHRTIARLTGTSDAEWGEGQVATHRGAFLRSGHRVELTEGLARIEYGSGAIVILQGPASYVVGDALPPKQSNSRRWGSLGQLHAGALTARFDGPPDGLGIETKWGVVLHVGTEFGLMVGPESDTEVKVFDGAVELRANSDASLMTRLTEGQSARVSDDGEVMIAIESPQRKFIRAEDFARLDQRAEQGVLLWQFDDPNQLGQDLHGLWPALRVVGNARYVPGGRHGGALALDGEGDMLEATGGAGRLPVGNSPYTIAAWIKPSRTGACGIVGWGDYGNPGRVNALRINDSNGFVHYWWANDLIVNDWTVTDAGVDLDSGEWAHVAVTWDRRVRRFYLNGRMIAQDEPAAPNVAGEQFAIGRTAPATKEFFGGLIDDVALFRVALDNAEIEAAMNGEFDSSHTKTEDK